MDLTYTEPIEAYIAQIDFKKAFDSIEWLFLFKTLKIFIFGENFINWIKIFYTDISSCVGNNGFYYFKLKTVYKAEMSDIGTALLSRRGDTSHKYKE